MLDISDFLTAADLAVGFAVATCRDGAERAFDTVEAVRGRAAERIGVEFDSIARGVAERTELRGR